MEMAIHTQEAGIGLIGWIIVFAAIYFLKDAFGNKKNKDDNSKDGNAQN